jgi:16S rRNA (cytidine1402-2'-O)-methyltransferase
MPGTLHLVATPIGNLEDITLRALRVLREVALIAAEDTRRSARLLTHYGISTPTLSYHEHNRRSRLPRLLGRLTAGDDVALVTDAGTPGVSDPGVELVNECVRQAIPVNPVPGVSAPLTAALASGFPLIPFTIFGFAPAGAKARRRWMEELSAVPHTFSFFETPHRLRQTLADAGPILGERQIVVARELTKVHQEFVRGSAVTLAERVPIEKGEFTLVVGPLMRALPANDDLSDGQIAAEFGRMTDGREGLSRRAAIALLARKTGRRARDVYAVLERSKNSTD